MNLFYYLNTYIISCIFITICIFFTYLNKIQSTFGRVVLLLRKGNISKLLTIINLEKLCKQFHC